ncbi:superoxide dismutase, Ni [Patescibacteria group bacterium]|nr:superoxide dismutase, Ni [Patescibacteria group bacterium]MCL5010005.1 superoxide dismutase, Ni [Patescibacteria group bacterium]
MKTAFDFLLGIVPRQIAYAHCDIPCGIYDPHLAQVSAHTVIRMTDLILDLKKEETETGDKEFMHKIARYTKVKEEHAEMVKHEVRIIWGDYFKEEHLKDYPDLHNLVFKIMKLASKTRQEVDKQSASDLLSSVQEFAQIFWKTKNRETVKVSSSYPTGGEIVLPK